MPAGPPGDLHQRREQPLRRPEIGGEQPGVGVDHHHQGQPAEVVAFREHLGADQQVDLAGMRGREEALGRAAAAGDIPVEPGDAGVREETGESFLQPLRAPAQRSQVLVAAGRAGARRRRFGGAVMTDQAVARRREAGIAGAALAMLAPFDVLISLYGPS